MHHRERKKTYTTRVTSQPRSWLTATAAGLLAIAGSATSYAGSVDLGYVSYDEGTQAANVATFDIANFTGPNAVALGDPADFPVYGTSVSFSNLDLLVTFANGSTRNFVQSDFKLGPDGLSFDGPPVVFGAGNDAVSATLTGTLSTTSLTLANGTTESVNNGFTATITDATGGSLQNGDLALITATPAGGPSTVPEPGVVVLFGAALAGLAIGRRRGAAVRALCTAGVMSAAMLLAPPAADAAVNLSTVTTPTSGLAGTSSVNLTTVGLPTGTLAAQVTVNVAPTCGIGASSVAGEASTVASAITTVVGSVRRVGFKIPGALTTGTYYVWLSGTNVQSNSCAILAVTASNTTTNACVPSSSLAVAIGKTVTAYVPNGYWRGSATGIRVVAIESSGTAPAPVTVPTANPVNACAANPATGQAVCTANTTDVYLLKGTTVTNTLTSGLNSTASFSGGSCNNCGVAMNAVTNTAYVSGGISSSAGAQAIQALHLSTNTFDAPFVTKNGVSENISVDATRGLILNPNETYNFDLLRIDVATGSITAEYGNAGASGRGEFDSAAEDCTTGIALSSKEFEDSIFITDLKQAAFDATTQTWSGPSQSVYVGSDSLGGFSAGTNGLSIAPGSGHLGVVTGEFGGNTVSVLKLPSTSGSGTPGLADYVYFTLPASPDGTAFAAGYDPHTTTAYTSPNNQHAYGVIADWATGAPRWLAVIDLAQVLALPRGTGTPHTLSPTVDLIATGAVRYVSTQ